MGQQFFIPQRPIKIKPVAPLREALNSMLRKPISKKLVPDGAYNFREDIPETSYHEIQDHCCLHGLLSWGTGIAIMDAADLMVQEAVDNANIAAQDENGLLVRAQRPKPKNKPKARKRKNA